MSNLSKFEYNKLVTRAGKLLDAGAGPAETESLIRLRALDAMPKQIVKNRMEHAGDLALQATTDAMGARGRLAEME